MKIGDIILNKCVSDTHPFQYSVLIREEKEYSTCLYPYQGKLLGTKYYTDDLKKGSYFRKVGHINLRNIILDEITKIKSEQLGNGKYKED